MATEQDFFNFFSSLQPAEQRKFLSSFGGTEENLEGQSAFADDPYENTDPVLSMGAGAPQMDLTSMMLGQMAGGAYPQYTAAGKLDPLDLSQLAQRLNYTQDLGGSMFDNATALFAGPDAFGAMDQFSPITKYTGNAAPAQFDDQGNPAPVTKSSMALQVAKKSGGARGFIADLIDQGVDPDAAVAALRDVVTNGVNATDPKVKKQAEDIRRTLDVWRSNDPLTGAPKPVDRNTAPWESFDEDSLRKTAQDMFEQKLTDEMAASTMVYDPQSGKYYEGQETEPSPAAKKFRDAGLPLPNETYQDPARLDAMNQSTDPGYMANAQYYQSQDQARGDDLEQRRQDLLAKQLDLQNWDRQLHANSTPVDVPDQRRLINRDFSFAPKQPLVLPPGFSSQTQPNAPTMQGVNAQGQPAVAQTGVVRDSFGRPRQTNDQAFDFGKMALLFPGANPGGQGVRTNQPLKPRNAQADRQANLKADQQWRDQYNRNYAAQHRRASTPQERNADMLAGAMRARAQVSTPLQDTLLARLMSLRNRAGI